MSTQVTASEQSVVIAREKGKADAALEEAIPALEMAESALANLHKEDITEVKNFAKPPALTQRDFLQFLNLNFASTASTRCHAAVTPSS